MRRTTCLALILLATLVARGTAVGDANATEPPETALADAERLERALPFLDHHRPSVRLGALQTLLHLADRRLLGATALERIVARCAMDPDPLVAGLALRALDRPSHPAGREAGSDEEIRRRADQERLTWAQEVLADRSQAHYTAGDHLAAAQIVVDTTSRAATIDAELEWLIAAMTHSPDPEVQRLADVLHSRSKERRRTRPDPRADAVYAATDDPHPDVRLSSLRWVVDIALSEGVESDPRILDALLAHMTDPDPRVAAFVHSALNGLAGDRLALDEVVHESTRLQEAF